MTALKVQQTNSISDDYYPQDDISIAKRLAESQGLGQAVYYQDDDMAGLISDFGVRE